MAVLFLAERWFDHNCNMSMVSSMAARQLAFIAANNNFQASVYFTVRRKPDNLTIAQATQEYVTLIVLPYEDNDEATDLSACSGLKNVTHIVCYSPSILDIGFSLKEQYHRRAQLSSFYYGDPFTNDLQFVDQLYSVGIKPFLQAAGSLSDPDNRVKNVLHIPINHDLLSNQPYIQSKQAEARNIFCSSIGKDLAFKAAKFFESLSEDSDDVSFEMTTSRKAIKGASLCLFSSQNNPFWYLGIEAILRTIPVLARSDSELGETLKHLDYRWRHFCITMVTDEEVKKKLTNLLDPEVYSGDNKALVKDLSHTVKVQNAAFMIWKGIQETADGSVKIHISYTSKVNQKNIQLAKEYNVCNTYNTQNEMCADSETGREICEHLDSKFGQELYTPVNVVDIYMASPRSITLVVRCNAASIEGLVKHVQNGYLVRAVNGDRELMARTLLEADGRVVNISLADFERGSGDQQANGDAGSSVLKMDELEINGEEVHNGLFSTASDLTGSESTASITSSLQDEDTYINEYQRGESSPGDDTPRVTQQFTGQGSPFNAYKTASSAFIQLHDEIKDRRLADEMSHGSSQQSLSSSEDLLEMKLREITDSFGVKTTVKKDGDKPPPKKPDASQKKMWKRVKGKVKLTGGKF